MLSRLLNAASRSPAGKGLTSWLSFVVFNCVIVTFPFGILGQVSYLIVSIPDLCPLSFYSTTYIYCFGTRSRSLIAYKFIIFRPSTTSTMPLTTQILRTATKWFATSQRINRKYAKHSIHSLVCILHYMMPLNHN